MSTGNAVNAILKCAQDDWIYLDEVVDAVRTDDAGLEGEALVDAVIVVLREVVQQGLMEIGDIKDGFKPWPISLDAAIQRIRDEWQPPGRELTISDICWLANTTEGDRIAESLR